METLRVIDADTHVDETDDTWAYVPPTDEELKLIRDVIDPKGLREKEVPS